MAACATFIDHVHRRRNRLQLYLVGQISTQTVKLVSVVKQKWSEKCGKLNLCVQNHEVFNGRNKPQNQSCQLIERMSI